MDTQLLAFTFRLRRYALRRTGRSTRATSRAQFDASHFAITANAEVAQERFADGVPRHSSPAPLALTAGPHLAISAGTYLAR